MPSLFVQLVKIRFNIHLIIFDSTYYNRLLEFSSEKKTESEKQNIEMSFNYKLRQKQV